MKRWLKVALGWAFVMLGLVGLVLPVLQGVLFLAIGLGILAQESEWARLRLDALRQRYPQVSKTFDKAAARTDSVLGHFGGRSSE